MTIHVPDFQPPFDEDESTVRARMENDAEGSLDTREGSWFQLLTEPQTKEVARVYEALNQSLAMAFPMYAFGIYLDYTAAEYGVTRKPATRSEGRVTLTGDPGTFIPLGTRLSVPASTATQESIYFVTTEEVTIDGAGVASAGVRAEEDGARSNVAAGSITFIEDRINGLTAVTNDEETIGGADIEEDESLRQRVLLEITAPQAAGSVSDHERWMLAQDGVAAVTVVPLWDGPNTVKNVILGEDNNPASQSVLDAAQAFLTGPPVIPEPEVPVVLTTGTAGALTDTFYYRVTFVDDSGGETKGGPASPDITAAAQRIEVTGIPIGPTGVVARRLYRATSPSGPFRMVTQIDDNTTTAFSDNVADVSSGRVIPKVNNTTEYLGQAPIGQRITVDTPSISMVDIAATVIFDAGYSLDGAGGTVATRLQIEAALESYVNGQEPGGDIVYNQTLAEFFEVTGVYDVTSLTINGVAATLELDPDEVASLGTVVLS